MKVIVLDENLSCADFQEKLKRPLDIYGFFRKSEELCYVLKAGKRVSSFPLIGHIVTNGKLPSDSRLVGMFQNGDLTFFYRAKHGWQKVEHQIVTSNTIFLRMPFSKKLMDVLNKSCVVIFGVGSGGSGLAIGLARVGITNFRLIDPDRLSIENISRHEGNLYDVGRFKVQAIKQKILQINPLARVETYTYDVFKRPSVLARVFRNADLVIGATDKQSAQLKINNECWHRRITALFGGCYEEAKGGEVLYVIPGTTLVCLECRHGAVKRPDTMGKIPYSNAQGPEDYKGEPGLNAAINLITDVAQQYAIALLLRNEECEIAKLIDRKRNLILVGGALGEGYYIFKKPFHFINPALKGPWKDCGTCQNKQKSEATSKDSKKGDMQGA